MQNGTIFRTTLFSLAALLALAFCSLASAPARAEDGITVPGGGGGDFTVPVKTLRDMRFINVIRQRMDFSCGSAALATLLTYYYETPVDEYTVLYDMYEHGDKDKIHKEGFSLLDMIAYLG
jgi:hypothetical protein